MGYTVNESMVRVDIFKPSGKWYESIAIDMNEFYNEPIIHDALKKALAKGDTNDRKWETIDGSERTLTSKFAICLHPYHENAFPICVWLK